MNVSCINISLMKSRIAAMALAALFGGASLMIATAVPLSTSAQALTASQESAIQSQVATAIAGYEGASDAELQSALSGVVAQLVSQYSGQDLVDALALLVVTAGNEGASAGLAAQAVIDGAPGAIAGAALGKAAVELALLNNGQSEAVAQVVANSGDDAVVVAFAHAAPQYAYMVEGSPQYDKEQADNTRACGTPSCA